LKKRIKLFDIENRTKIGEIRVFDDARPWKVIGLESERYAISCSWQKPDIMIHDLRSNECVRVIRNHNRGVNDLKIYKNSYILSGSYDETIRVSKILDQGFSLSFPNAAPIYSCCIDPCSTYIMGLTDKSYQLKVFSNFEV